MAGSGEPRLLIVGDGEFAEIAYEYFTHDSPYQVAGFSVERAFLRRDRLFGLPVVAFEEAEQHFSPADCHGFVAVTQTKLNRVRTRLYHASKAKGYRLATYISSRAFVWHNASIGDNCFIFENNVVQHFVRIGNNVILWSGNHIGHRTVIGDNCFLSSHVVISGFCEIGESCFFGVNSGSGDNVKIARDCVIAAGTLVTRDTVPGKVYKSGREPEPRADSLAIFRARDLAR